MLGLFSFRAAAVPAPVGPPMVAPMPAPAAITPSDEDERAALELAAQQVPSDWTTPISIAGGSTAGTYLITYATDERELELLGPRQAIVDPAAKTVQLVPRD
jgi:hypothetical protein